MNAVNLGALLTFVFVTTFTPGPNNISSSSMGILYGYRKTLHYLFGITVGFFLIMLSSALVSHTLYTLFPWLESVMRIIGALYILWLAYKTLKSSYQFSQEAAPTFGFRDGLLLQMFNPKVWLYGLTLYTTFLTAVTANAPLLLVSAVLLALVGFLSISTWTLSGAAIKCFLHILWMQKAINIGLALLLIYSAIELSGLL